jgi:hypothetical protein
MKPVCASDKLRRILLIAGVIALLLATTLAGAKTLAQEGGGFELSWSTIDGGGGLSSGGGYALNGTIGQSDTGISSGGGFQLRGGFWAEAANLAPPKYVYLPLVRR